MTTKLEIIHGAYAEIGLANYVFDLQPEELTAALRRLDNMLIQWDARGIRIGYDPSASINQDAGVPDWTVDPCITNLALRLAPTKGKQVSPDTRIAARAGYRTLLMGDYKIPQMQFPATMPIGTGNKRATKNRQFYQPTDRVETTHDAFLDPDGSGTLNNN